jgi:hypothetical protein
MSPTNPLTYRPSTFTFVQLVMPLNGVKYMNVCTAENLISALYIFDARHLYCLPHTWQGNPGGSLADSLALYEAGALPLSLPLSSEGYAYILMQTAPSPMGVSTRVYGCWGIKWVDLPIYPGVDAETRSVIERIRMEGYGVN